MTRWFQATTTPMGNPMTASAVAGLLQRAGSVIIASHRDPDGDALGATLGLMHMLKGAGKNVTVYSAGPLPEEYAFLPGVDGLTGQVSEEYDLAVLVDCHDAQRVGPLGSDVIASAGDWVAIDHHRGEAPDAGAAWIDTTYAAVCQMLVDLAEDMDWAIGPEAAACLFVGIQTDTGSFRYSNTTPQALLAASKLVAAGAEPWAISQEVYATRPVRLKLLGRVMDGVETYARGRLAVAKVSLADLDKVRAQAQDLEQAVEAIRGIPGVQVAVLLRQTEDGLVKLSMRSRGLVDVAAVARGLGGGGHHNAAGARVEGSLDDVAAKIQGLLLPLVEGL